jgi:hypothetical protein
MASAQFIPGALTTSSNGVSIQATVQTNVIMSKKSDTARLTVNGEALFISMGRSSTLEESANGTEYEKKFSVYVTDANGAPITNRAVTLSIYPTIYGKGHLVWDSLSDPQSWVYAADSPTVCANEDINRNGQLDNTGMVSYNGIEFWGEDFNRNGLLDNIGMVSLNGTPFWGEDLNHNGILDWGQDVNHNGILDYGMFIYNGITYWGEDLNHNGKLDLDEDINKNGILDPGEDTDGDGILDPTEDKNNNGILDNEDVNGNGILGSEDVNNNGILDIEDTSGNGKLDIEDVNGDGKLWPGIPVTIYPSLVTTVVTTDSSGFAPFKLTYGKGYAWWVSVEITARSFVGGTESRQTQTYDLEMSIKDATNKGSAVNNPSPFGITTRCTNKY